MISLTLKPPTSQIMYAFKKLHRRSCNKEVTLEKLHWRSCIRKVVSEKLHRRSCIGEVAFGVGAASMAAGKPHGAVAPISSASNSLQTESK